MKALILAAGFGVRLREIIHGRPKHLAPINGKPFLRHLIDMLKSRGVDDIVLGVGYLAKSIKDEFSDFKFSEDDRPLGTAGTLKNAETLFEEDFILVNGDTYLDIDYQDLMVKHKIHKKIVTMVVRANHLDLSCGVYAISPRIFSLIKPGRKTSLEKEILPKLKTKHELELYPTNARFIDIGSPEGYQEAKKELQ